MEHTFPFLCYQEHEVFGKLWHLESGLMCPQTLQPTIHQRVRMTSLLLASTKAFFNKCRRIFQYQEIEKILPRVRIELTTFRLWDWRAAYCAIEALKSQLKSWGNNPESTLTLQLWPQHELSITKMYCFIRLNNLLIS